MKKFFITVICIAIAAMVGYGIKYAVTPINTQKLSYITQENAINTNGFIIRDEWVMYSRSAGTAYHSVAEVRESAKTVQSVLCFTAMSAMTALKNLPLLTTR